MAKKDRNQEFVPEQTEIIAEDEPMFEAEAYGSPQPDAGSDVTVLKQVGLGGPVPIVAPKHNTIQLQPIIVPLAVVPYMTQDSGVLRTDGKPAGGVQPLEYDEATEFEPVEKSAENAKAKAKPAARKRIFALITMLLSALVLFPYILARFIPSIGPISLVELDIITLIQLWATKAVAFSFQPVENILHIVVAATSAILTVTSFIALIAGAYPRAFTGIFSFIGMGCTFAVLIMGLVNFIMPAVALGLDARTITVGVLEKTAVVLVVFVLALTNFVLSVVFSSILNRMEDKLDEKNNVI